MSRAAVLLLVVVGVSGAADARASEEHATDDLQAALIYAAEIRSMVETCMEETPEVAAHLHEAHQDWLARHPAIATKLAELRSGSQSSQADAQVVEQAAQEQTERLRQELAAEPQDFAARCDHFVKDLDQGVLDYPPG